MHLKGVERMSSLSTKCISESGAETRAFNLYSYKVEETGGVYKRKDIVEIQNSIERKLNRLNIKLSITHHNFQLIQLLS